jgi:hypothetical protein
MYPLHRRLGEPHSRYGRYGKEKILEPTGWNLVIKYLGILQQIRASTVQKNRVGSCDQVPGNITANTGQHSSEESGGILWSSTWEYYSKYGSALFRRIGWDIVIKYLGILQQIQVSTLQENRVGSCDQVPENIRANTGQHCSEESGGILWSSTWEYYRKYRSALFRRIGWDIVIKYLGILQQMQVSTLQKNHFQLSKPRTGIYIVAIIAATRSIKLHSEERYFFLKFLKDVDSAHLFHFLFQCVFRTMYALFIYPFL